MGSTASLSELLDRAVRKLGPLRRVTTERRFRRNPEYRQAVLEEIAIKLVDDERAIELLGAETCLKLADGSIALETGFFEVDNIDNLERILKLMVEYLPQILEIVLKLFATILMMLAFSLITSTANAQHWSYPRGSIEAHLQADHGVATAGMSREQMLSYHDSLHEGRAYSPAQTSTRLVSRSLAPVRRVAGLLRRR